VADAGPDQSIYVGEAGLLQGSATDPNNNAILAWLWTLEAAPAGSSVTAPAVPSIHPIALYTLVPGLRVGAVLLAIRTRS
jgi:hypothetical protein